MTLQLVAGTSLLSESKYKALESDLQQVCDHYISTKCCACIYCLVNRCLQTMNSIQSKDNSSQAALDGNQIHDNASALPWKILRETILAQDNHIQRTT